jgi:8-oxo-dGTP diphosphatase
MNFKYEFPRPSLTVDIVLFGQNPTRWIPRLEMEFRQSTQIEKVLLIKRKNDPFKGRYALPGGFVNVSDEGNQGETFLEAASRELKEETNLEVRNLRQLGVYGDPGRDPRGRVISIAFIGVVSVLPYTPVAGDDAAEAQWCDLDNLHYSDLAFDHSKILRDARDYLKSSR